MHEIVLRNVFRDRRRRVRPGAGGGVAPRRSLIITDGWPAYTGLDRIGY